MWRQEQVSHPTVPISSQPESHNEPQRSDSFYWQSPHSSIHSTKDDDEDANAVNPSEETAPKKQPSYGADKDSKTIGAPSLVSQSAIGPYGASALGFGGPSDWEHFGDYEAEEIDDTELYTRAKSPVKIIDKPESAELPATDPAETQFSQHESAPDAEPDSSALTSPQHTEPIISYETQKLSSAEARPDASMTLGNVRHNQASDGHSSLPRQSTGQEVRPVLEVEIASPVMDFPGKGSFTTDIDETIKAWSGASSTQGLDETDESSKENERANMSSHAACPIEGSSPEPVTDGQSVYDLVSVDGANSSKITEPPMNGAGPKVHATTVDADSHTLSQASSRRSLVTSSPMAERRQSMTSISDFQEASTVERSQDVSQVKPSLAASLGPSAKTKETDDPYAGLDPWGKASLNRYIAMLREESKAETDRDKFNIFTVFTSRETRLRAVLYGTENGAVTEQAASEKTGSIKRASTTAFNPASKALPALPGEETQQGSSHNNGHVRQSPEKPSALAVLGAPKPKPTLPKAINTMIQSPTKDADMVESPASVQYSPGGRPIVPKAILKDRMSFTSEPENLALAVGDNISNSRNPTDLPVLSSTEQPRDEQSQGDASPIYKPFKYSEGRSEAQNYAANRQSKRQSQFRPYAAKRASSDEYREMFLIEKPNAELVLSSSKTSQPTIKPEEEAKPDLRRFVHADFDPLLSVLPESGDVHPNSVRLSDLKQRVEAVPDDFSFIHQSVVAWDAKARRRREINERERHARQVDSEQKIDALFDDHEIGYGDISELESGFKRSEAAKKADEDRSEYKTFVAEVFNIVWARLHYEIDLLSPHYAEYTQILNDTTAGKDMFDTSGDRFALAPTMDSLLTLHQKLEIRYQKAFEAVLERDRRLKKTELSPWYSLGNVAKVKQLEKQFEGAEKKAIVEYCRQRDIRANNLMDVLDQNTLRGVGANQDYMEMVMKAVRRIASGRAFASQPGAGEAGVGLEEVTRAKSVTKALATSSEQIVQTFHVADMLLNAADYELSVAKAKLSGADVITFQTLKEERAKEDQKLMRDLEHRLALIREDSRRTHDEIVKLLLFLGVQSGHAGNATTVASPTKLEHEERLSRALEEAKQRNALKESGATTGAS